MSHEPVKLYAAALIRAPGDDDKVLLTRHDASSPWHFPDSEASPGRSSWSSLKTALQEDFPNKDIDLDVYPCQVTEIIKGGIRHVTLHYTGRVEGAVLGPRGTLLKRLESRWVSLHTKIECYTSTRIVLDRLHAIADRR